VMQDIPALKLRAGDIGAVVLVHGDHAAYAVELAPGGYVVDITPGYLELVE
jgi:Domain of unknown function (DUF4926)